MTQAEAVRLCKELAGEHADRFTHGWLPRRLDGDDWEVVKVPRPPGAPRGELKEGVEASEPPRLNDIEPGIAALPARSYLG